MLHYLEKSKARISARLPKDIEYLIREEDATYMALHMFRSFDHEMFSEKAVDDVIEAFRNLIIELL
jgi:hypothetical protein